MVDTFLAAAAARAEDGRGRVSPTDEAEWMEEEAMCEKGTSTEYLIECSSWTTTLDTLRNDSFLRWLPLPVAACPMALRTCNVLNSRGCWLVGCRCSGWSTGSTGSKGHRPWID